MIGQADGIAVRVDLPLALVQVGIHLGEVALPAGAGRTVVEGIGIGIDADERELAVDDTGQHVLQMLILPRELHVRPDLRAGIAQPHGVDIARVDKGAPATRLVLSEMDGRVERVREAVGEHPGEPGIRQLGADLGNLILHGLAHKEPVGRGGPLGNERLGIPHER